MKLKYDWIREQVNEGEINIKWKDINENLADMFKKILSLKKFEKFNSMIMT